MELIKSLGGYENVVVCWLRFLQKTIVNIQENEILNLYIVTTNLSKFATLIEIRNNYKIYPSLYPSCLFVI